MHETSLVEFALSAVESRAKAMGIEKIKEVGLVIGRLSAVEEQMEMAFRIIRQKHPMCIEAELHLDMREIRLRCKDCGCEYDSPDVFSCFTCPDCGSEKYDILSGKELQVDYFIPAD